MLRWCNIPPKIIQHGYTECDSGWVLIDILTPHTLYSGLHMFHFIAFESWSPHLFCLMTSSLPHPSLKSLPSGDMNPIPPHNPSLHLFESLALLFSLLTGGGDVRTLMHREGTRRGGGVREREYACMCEREMTSKEVLCSLILNVGRGMRS